MKASILNSVCLLALLPFIAAQTAPQLPQCGVDCAVAGLAASGCAPEDVACICSNTDYLDSVRVCIGSTCSLEDQRASRVYGNNLCPPGNPEPVPDNSTAATSSTSAASVPTPATNATVGSSSSPSVPAYTGAAMRMGTVSSTVGGLAALAYWLVAV